MRLLDLFCKAGGAAMGYHRSGFDEIVGIDIEPQKRYPFEFIQCDAMEYVRDHWVEFDAIHASPPCQRFSTSTPVNKRGDHPDLVKPIRSLLKRSCLPWVIENVAGAPLRDALVLCGSMFGLDVQRHRLFESNCFLMSPGRCRHGEFRGSFPPLNEEMRRANKASRVVGVYGGGGGKGTKDLWSMAIGIDWMTKDELTQAIPPAYTEYIGRQLLDHIRFKAGNVAS